MKMNDYYFRTEIFYGIIYVFPGRWLQMNSIKNEQNGVTRKDFERQGIIFRSSRFLLWRHVPLRKQL